MGVENLALREMLGALSEASGVSGAENEVGSLMEKYIRPHVDRLEKDSFGNVIALKRGTTDSRRRHAVFIAAHLDEIGLMVTRVDECGFIRFTTIGGFDPRTLWGQSVTVHGKELLRGVIGTLPPHVIKPGEAKKAVRVEKMFIDVGLSAQKAADLVSTGDTITIYRRFTPMKDPHYMSGKALDNRAGVAAIIHSASVLEKLKHTADLYFVGTAQEEVGTRGAVTSAYSVNPDIGVAIDVCHGDMPGVSDEDTFELGKGPAIAVGPNVHPLLAEKIQQVAEELGIAVNLDPTPGPTPTDARSIQLAREGVPSALISVPLRYMHTSVELVHARDIIQAGRLIAYLMLKIDDDFMNEIKNYD